MQHKLTVTTMIIALSAMFTTQAAATPFPECVSTPAVVVDGTVVDAALATPELSTLVTAVTAAGLGDLLATSQGIRVFAPTNAAFAKIPEGLLTALLADVDALTAVLAYHVTTAKADPRRFLEPRRVGSLAGQSLFYHWMGREPKINSATLSCTPVHTSNGIVYIVDSVLMPHS